MGLFHDIYKDFRRYRAADESWFSACFMNQGFWASCVYRAARYTHLHLKFRPLRLVSNLFFAFAQKFIEIITGIAIPAECDIGEGIFIGYFGPTILPRHGKLGKNCNVQQGVTIAVSGHGSSCGAPRIGDRVHVGPNAVILGKIDIGDDCAIAAGSFVNSSIPPRSIVMGNPARVISSKGSFEMIRYDGMEADLTRHESLSKRPPQLMLADTLPVPQSVAQSV